MFSRVYIEITNICNMRCSFCHGHSRPLARMDTRAFGRVLEQLSGQTQYLYYHLMGEPLTHPELPQFLRMAGEKGFRSMLTTNGTLLAERGAPLLEAGLHKVNVSLHSFEGEDTQVYEKYLQDVADFAKKATAKGVIISLRLWNRGCDDGRNDTALAQLHSCFPEPWTENSRGYRIREKLFLEWGDRFAWPDRDAPLQREVVSCYGMRDHFGILCDGTVVPCCLDSDGVIDLGNVFTQELEEILNSPRARAMAEGFRRRCPTEDLCRRCGYATRFT